MNILITGVAGFLGSHLAEALRHEHNVSGVDNLIGGYIENVPLGIEFYQFDTANYDNMNAILHKERPDIIYHCACTAYEGLSVFSPSLITQNTFQNTAGILSAAIKNKVKRFIYTSSMARYGSNSLPFTEDMTPHPEDPYGLAKVASEKLIDLMAKQHKFEWVIAVPHNIIGIRQKYNDPYRNVASIMINRILQKKPIIIYGDGEQTRSFSFVEDCLEPLLRMIDCPTNKIYNIGPDDKDGEVVTVNQLAKIISKLLGWKKKPIYFPARPCEVKHAYCSSDKIRKEFNYKTETKLEKGLQSMIDDIQKKGTKPFKYHLPIEITKGCPTTWTRKKM